MTDSDRIDHKLDEWLTTQFVELVNDLAESLDLGAGSVEALQALDFRNLAADLTEHLEVAAGLTAVLNETRPVALPEDVKSADGPLQTAVDTDSMVERAARALASIDALSRLQLRADSEYAKFRASIGLVIELARVDRLAGEIQRELLESDDGRVAAYSLANQALHILRVGVSRDRDLDYFINRDRDGNYRMRLTARDRCFDLCQSLLSSGPDCDASHLLWRLSELVRAVRSARAGALERTRLKAGKVFLSLALGDVNTDLASLSELVELHDTLASILSDFIGADLRSASLADVPLVGIRWSVKTLWPMGWMDRIRAASTEVAFEVFEITDGRGENTRVAQKSGR
jgi:hypothetical protein